MKKPTSLSFLLVVVCMAACGKVQSQTQTQNQNLIANQNQGCTFEQAVTFNTAIGLAEADYVTAIETAGGPLQAVMATVPAFNAYKTKIESAADGLPSPCLRELATAESHVSECQAPIQNAFATITDRLASAAQQYAQTGNRQEYETNMHGIIATSVNKLPRQCWIQPVTLPSQSDPSYCQQAWSAYSQCYQANQNVLQQGGTLQVCYRPLCLDGDGDGHNGDCQQKWFVYNQCNERFKRCLATGGRACMPCQKPNC